MRPAHLTLHLSCVLLALFNSCVSRRLSPHGCPQDDAGRISAGMSCLDIAVDKGEEEGPRSNPDKGEGAARDRVYLVLNVWYTPMLSASLDHSGS